MTEAEYSWAYRSADSVVPSEYDFHWISTITAGCLSQLIKNSDLTVDTSHDLSEFYKNFKFVNLDILNYYSLNQEKTPVFLTHLYCEQALFEFVMAHVPSPAQAVTDFVPKIVTDKNYQLLHDLSERIFTDYCLVGEEAELCTAYHQALSLRGIGQSYNAIVEDVTAYLQSLRAENFDPAFQQAFLQKYQSFNFLSFNLIEVYFPQIAAQFEDERTSYMFSQEVKIPLFLAVLFLKQLLLCYCLRSAKAAMVDQK